MSNDYQRVVLYLLKELKKKNIHGERVISNMKDVILNPTNTNEYVYQNIYENIEYLRSIDADEIICFLGESGRL